MLSSVVASWKVWNRDRSLQTWVSAPKSRIKLSRSLYPDAENTVNAVNAVGDVSVSCCSCLSCPCVVLVFLCCLSLS